MKTVNRRPGAFDEIVAQNLRRLRLLSGMSQGELGERLGVTTQQIQKYERASNRLSAGAIVEIATTLGVEITDLYRGCGRGDDGEDRSFSSGQIAVALEFGRIPDPKMRRLASALVRALANVPAAPRQDPES